jgi:hypothetical protein
MSSADHGVLRRLYRYHESMKRVLIRGDGIAARCCEHLLTQAGCEVASDLADRPRLPAIMLGGAAISMMRDVFAKPELFAGCHRIRKRAVAWGPCAELVMLDHSAIVVSEQELLSSVGPPSEHAWIDADWTIITSRPLPEGSIEHRFGTRLAHALPVAITGDSDICWIESLDAGWLFLIPTAENAGWLLAVGAESQMLLEESRFIAPRIEGVGSAFPAYPRIMNPLAGDHWIACGSAAMAFDPLCGDGTANAVREAILAAAVIRAGEEAVPHYEARLLAGFQRHLATCVEFYQSGGAGAWWGMETAALRTGLEWCAARSRSFGPYRYQLQGFDLVPVLP